jgi:hypothetical protein
VVGEYQTPDGKFHGFRWERGRITTIDAPGAAGTSLTDINDRGQILGARLEPDGTGRGFVLDRGRFVTFRAPDAPLTFPYDLNNRGQIVGYALAPTAADPLAGARGFLLAKGARGPLTPIDVPGAKKRGDRSQRPRSARRLLREPQRRADPAAHRTAAGGPDGLTAGASSGEPSAPAPRPARVASPNHPGPGR